MIFLFKYKKEALSLILDILFCSTGLWVENVPRNLTGLEHTIVS